MQGLGTFWPSVGSNPRPLNRECTAINTRPQAEAEIESFKSFTHAIGGSYRATNARGTTTKPTGCMSSSSRLSTFTGSNQAKGQRLKPWWAAQEVKGEILWKSEDYPKE